MRIYTDGSAHMEDGTAGYGCVYIYNTGAFYAKFDRLPEGTTNQQAELLAAYYALKEPDLKSPITLVSDSQYLVTGMNEWAVDWLSRALRWYGIAIFGNETTVELYRILRTALGPHRPLALETSSQNQVANQAEWEMLWQLLLIANYTIKFEKTMGHTDDFFNNRADELARWGRLLTYEMEEL